MLTEVPINLFKDGIRGVLYGRDADGVSGEIPLSVLRNNFGLEIGNNPTNPTTQIDITPGRVKNIVNNTFAQLNSLITKDITSTWVQGNGNGGLDVGSVTGDTTYHVILIENDATKVTDIIISLSPDTPVLPAGWIFIKRVASFVTLANGDIVGFRQAGQFFHLNEPEFDYSLTSTSNDSTTIVNITLPRIPIGFDNGCITLLNLGEQNGSWSVGFGNTTDAVVDFEQYITGSGTLADRGNTGTISNTPLKGDNVLVTRQRWDYFNFSTAGSPSGPRREMFLHTLGWIDFEV